VDTETPRPEKLVVDFDTTVNSSPTDISGQGNHGTFGGVSSVSNYSAVDKAFNFDASTEYIDSTLNNTGDTDISVSLWLKRDADTTGTVWMIGNPTQTNGQNLGFDIYIASTNHIYLWTPNGPQLLDTDGALQFPVGQWVHLVCTRTGATLKVYIDGVDWTPNMTYSAAASGLALPANSKFRLGLRMAANVPFTGKISNSKVYNVVLEASEVQKLYRLGRTGRSMVISDTAVGIGKVPEAQLDVRGNLKVSGDILASVPYYAARQRNIGASSGSVRGIVYDSQVYTNYPGSFIANSNTDGYYQPPRNGMYHVHADHIANESGNFRVQRRTGTTVDITHDDRHWNYPSASTGWDSVSVSALIPITDCTTQNIRIYQTGGMVWSYATYHGSAYFKWFSDIPERREHHVA
jgi:hypothetical protein